MNVHKFPSFEGSVRIEMTPAQAALLGKISAYASQVAQAVSQAEQNWEKLNEMEEFLKTLSYILESA